MPTSNSDLHVNKRLLVWPMTIPNQVRALFTMVFMDIFGLVNYACQVLTKTDTFHLIIPLDRLRDLLNDPVYRFGQVVQIDVICDSIRDLKRARHRFGSGYEKVQFCTIHDLLGSLKKAEIDNALLSSDSIDGSTIDAILSLMEARISAKRSNIYIRRSQVRKQFISTSLYGFPVKNISDFAPSFICPICELVYQQPYQLECGHQLCKVCVNTQKSCATCFKLVIRDKVLLNQVLQMKMQNSFPHCSSCDWIGPLKDYQVHLKQNHDELITHFIRTQQVDERAFQHPYSTETNQEIFLGNLSSLDSDTTVTVMNGTCIWEVSDIEDTKNDATSGRRQSIYSAPFYIFPNAYKMCLRLYINGDGTARNTHMSVFFVIMRGKYDDNLQWPFKFKVTFSLINQSIIDDDQHISQFRWPDTNATCFKRPVADMNDGFGISLFFNLGSFEQNQNQFVKNDTMYIKFEVDLVTEKPTLPLVNGAGELPNDEEHVDATDDDISDLICHFDGISGAQQSN